MESLEVVLKRIEDLSEDLFADIVAQEEESHSETVWEQPYDPDWGGYATFYRQEQLVQKKVVDVPRITIPNTQVREAARAQLQKILDSSEWYAARCYAGWALDKNMYNLSEGWIAELKSQLADSALSVRLHAVKDLGKFYGRGVPVFGFYSHEETWGHWQYGLHVENTLRRCYNEDNDKAVRVEAGRKLGYNRLRILAHEISRKVSHYLLAK